MSIAAVPAYLGEDFTQASPGMRFGMYLAVWRHNWKKAENPHWQSICQMNNEKTLVKVLQERQGQQVMSMPSDALLMMPARSTAPFVTGMGNEHPLENGFSFLWPYGIPYLPGSGVKGVLRQAVRELLEGKWSDSLWQEAPGGEVTIDKKKKNLTALDVLFGLESQGGEKEHCRGVLSFWDVIPEIHGSKLKVEIMTPHQTHYYQDGEPPHDSGGPVPISFLTVPPGSLFPFHVVCDTVRLKCLAPALLQQQGGILLWKVLMQEAFELAFDWLGFGAKTAVGYGAMSFDPQELQSINARREEQQASARKEAEREAALAGLPQDAAWVERQKMQEAWNDNGTFIADVTGFVEEHEHLSAEALQRLSTEMNQRWRGIMNNPDATQGKRNKPKYNPKPVELAKRLLAMMTQQ